MTSPYREAPEKSWRPTAEGPFVIYHPDGDFVRAAHVSRVWVTGDGRLKDGTLEVSTLDDQFHVVNCDIAEFRAALHDALKYDCINLGGM